MSSKELGTFAVKRGRANRRPARAVEESLFVQVGAKRVLLRTHLAKIQDRCKKLVQVTTKNRPSVDQVAKALLCGTMLGQPQNGGDYQRLHYCRQNKLCVACRLIRNKNRAANIAGRIRKGTSCRSLSAVFAPKKQADFDTVVKQAEAALAGMRKLPKTINTWNKRSPNATVLEYAIGLHVKYDEDHQQLWPHLHLFLITEAGVHLEGLENLLRTGFFAGAGTSLDFRFESDPSAEFVIGTDGSVQVKAHRRKLTTEDLVKQLAYVMSTDEPQERSDALAARNELLARLGAPSTMTHSRIKQSDPSLPKTATNQPCEFHPAALGKNALLQLNFDGEGFQKISVDDYDERKRLAVVAAKNYLKREWDRLQPEEAH
ncbi:MAG: hypothetical protein NXI28_15890 [bacterium]|nr:hypothetical protein [bacterium]